MGKVHNSVWAETMFQNSELVLSVTSYIDDKKWIFFLATIKASRIYPLISPYTKKKKKTLQYVKISLDCVVFLDIFLSYGALQSTRLKHSKSFWLVLDFKLKAFGD